jgi:hypothetical protein
LHAHFPGTADALSGCSHNLLGRDSLKSILGLLGGVGGGFEGENWRAWLRFIRKEVRMRLSMLVLGGLMVASIASVSQAAEVECAGRVVKGDKVVKTFKLQDEGDEAMSTEVNGMAVVGSIADNGETATMVNISIGKFKAGNMVKGASMVLDVSSREALTSANRLNEPMLHFQDGANLYIVACRLKGSTAVGAADMFK